SSFAVLPPTPAPALFPYTTLFRSRHRQGRDDPPGPQRTAGLTGRHPHEMHVLADLADRVVDAKVLAADSDHGGEVIFVDERHARDRKSTRLNSSHLVISYAVFCLK